MKCIKCGVEVSGEKCSRCGFDFTSEPFVFFGIDNSRNSVLDKYRIAFQKENNIDNSLQKRIRELEQEVESLKKQLRTTRRNNAVLNKGGTNVARSAFKQETEKVEEKKETAINSHIEYEEWPSHYADLFNVLDTESTNFVLGKDYQFSRYRHSGLEYLNPGKKKVNQLYDNEEKARRISIQRFRTILSCFLILNAFDGTMFGERTADGRILNENLTKLYAESLMDEYRQNGGKLKIGWGTYENGLNRIVENIKREINREALKLILKRMTVEQQMEYEQMRDKETWGTTYIQSKGEWRMEILQAMVRYAYQYLQI